MTGWDPRSVDHNPREIKRIDGAKHNPGPVRTAFSVPLPSFLAVTCLTQQLNGRFGGELFPTNPGYEASASDFTAYRASCEDFCASRSSNNRSVFLRSRDPWTIDLLRGVATGAEMSGGLTCSGVLAHSLRSLNTDPSNTNECTSELNVWSLL